MKGGSVMLTNLRRLYLYLVATAALSFTTFAVEQFLQSLLDHYTLDPRLYPAVGISTVSQSVVLLAVAIVVAVPVGGLHWWFIRREGATDPTARGNGVRAFFVNYVLIGYISAAVGFGIAFVNSLGETYQIYQQGGTSVGIPGYNTAALAMLVTALLGTAALLAERRWTRNESPAAQSVSAVLFALAQIGWLIAALFGLSNFLQAVLDRVISAYPTCDFNSGYGVYGTQTGMCQPMGADLRYAVTNLIGFILGLTLFLWLARTLRGNLFQQIGAALLAFTAVIFAIVGITRLVFLLMTLIAGTPGNQPQGFASGLVDTYVNGSAYNYSGPFVIQPFLASLLAGLLGVAVVWVWFSGRTLGVARASRGGALVLFGLEFPLAWCFVVGLAGVLQYPFVHLLGQTTTSGDRAHFYSYLGLLVVGVAWPALTYALHRASRGDAADTSGARGVWRIYLVLITSFSTITALIGTAVAVYVLFSSIAGSPISGGTAFGSMAATLALVSVCTGVAHALLWREDNRAQAVAQAQQPVTTAPAPSTPGADETTLEAVLAQVAAGSLSVTEASQTLRSRYHIS